MLNKNDFEKIGLVAAHCNLPKLDIAIEEALQFDVINLFGYNLMSDVLANWGEASKDNPMEEVYKDLIFGKDYENSNGKHLNPGIKQVWVYYAYARYILINNYNDTANGMVKKDNDWSMPTPLKELTEFSNKYRSMGKISSEEVIKFLCFKKQDYPKFNDCGCNLACGCKGTCTCGKTKKLSGFKYKSVSKL